MKQSLECFKIKRKEFDGLTQFQIVKRWEWPAVFSTNSKRQIWVSTRSQRGYTHPSERFQLRGLSSTLDLLADKYLAIRDCGGRFFINEQGLFYKQGERDSQSTPLPGPLIQAIAFNFISQ